MPQNFSTPYDGAMSYMLIDPAAAGGGFALYDLFYFGMGSPIIATTTLRAFTGQGHPTSRYFKDRFKVVFPKLTEDQYNTLMPILQQTGANVLHTFILSYVGMSAGQKFRKYDNSTLWNPSYTPNVNADVKRKRGKVFVTNIDIPHWPGIGDNYSGSAEFEEA